MTSDQRIHDADPARDLDIAVPDPRLISRARPRHSAGRVRWFGRALVPALATTITVVVALAALTAGRDHAGSSAAIPSQLPIGSTLAPAGPTGVIRRTAQIRAIATDPLTGPAWALRTYTTASGTTCLQVGRTELGRVGAIGVDGSFADDGRFHPFSFSDSGLGQCVPNDARGHAFINVREARAPSSAGSEPCQRQGPRGHRGRCPATSLRDVAFGLLGPDATRITYVTDSGREVTQATRGPDGAYLIVRPIQTGRCGRIQMRQVGAPAACGTGSGEQLGPSVSAGEITAVTYRDGHVCHLPIPAGVAYRLGTCPAVGYSPGDIPRVTRAQIAAPVEVHPIPARYYCQRPGPFRPADLPVGCDATVPRGYVREIFTQPRPGHPGTDPGQNLLVEISWSAHAPVRDTNRSSYSFSLSYPRACNGGGGESSGTQARIATGERVTRFFFVTTDCHGTYTGSVTYIPDLGPGGADGTLVGAGARGPGTLLVGRFSFTVP